MECIQFLIYDQAALTTELINTYTSLHFPFIDTVIHIREIKKEYLDTVYKKIVFIRISCLKDISEVDQIKAFPNTDAILLLDYENKEMVGEFLRSRNERFLTIPIHEELFKGVVNDFIARYLSEELQLSLCLKNRLYLNHIQQHFINCVIINAPIDVLLEDLDILSISFTSGFFCIIDKNMQWELEAMLDSYNDEQILHIFKKVNIDKALYLIVEEKDTDVLEVIRRYYKKSIYLGQKKDELLDLHSSYLEAQYLCNCAKDTEPLVFSNRELIVLDDKKQSKVIAFIVRRIVQSHVIKDTGMCEKLINAIFLLSYYSDKRAREYIYHSFIHCVKEYLGISEFTIDPINDEKETELSKVYANLNEKISRILEGYEHKISYMKFVKIMNYIHSNYLHSPCSLNQIADAVYIDKAHICKLFAKYMRFTCSNYINDLKIHHSISLIYNEKITIRSIANKSNFNSTDYYIQMFKATLGLTPLQFSLCMGVKKA